MRVLLATTWQTACGIAEHAAYLKTAVEAADREIDIDPDPDALFSDAAYSNAEILHLNYQAALASKWTPERIYQQRDRGVRVVVTYHDTGVPNSDQCKAICAAADAAIVHEPFDDLVGKVHYWRMGVPDWQPPAVFDHSRRSWCGHRPILGSIGFPFPWKNFDLLAQITAELGWALLLIAPTATLDQIRTWRALNPHCSIEDKFLPADLALSRLAACDATAFPYVCHNTGQSGAILQGIAARKPVLAFATCRQFRALQGILHGHAITWCETVNDLRHGIEICPITGRPYAPMVALAEQESWTRLGQKYAELYRSLL